MLLLPMLVFAMVAHEYAHAYAALRQGDDTAYKLGRVTLNPIPHVDPWMSIALPAILWFSTGGQYTFGGAKPVPVMTHRYRHYVRGDLIVSGAGVATNLVLSVACTVIFVALHHVATVVPVAESVISTIQRMFMWGIWLNLVLCFFNLIPVPPLDGSHLFYHLLPAKAGAWYRNLNRFGYLPLFALMFLFRPAITVLMTPAFWLMNVYYRFISGYGVAENWNIFS